MFWLRKIELCIQSLSHKIVSKSSWPISVLVVPSVAGFVFLASVQFNSAPGDTSVTKMLNAWSPWQLENIFKYADPDYYKYQFFLFDRPRFDPNSERETANLHIKDEDLNRLSTPLAPTNETFLWDLADYSIRDRKTAIGSIERPDTQYPVFVRPTGQGTNHWGAEFKSYRVNPIPLPVFDVSVLPSEQRFVIPEYFLSEWFGFQVARRSGLLTTDSELVEFYLNNRLQGVRLRQDILGPRFLRDNDLPVGFFIDPVTSRIEQHRHKIGLRDATTLKGLSESVDFGSIRLRAISGISKAI